MKQDHKNPSPPKHQIVTTDTVSMRACRCKHLAQSRTVATHSLTELLGCLQIHCFFPYSDPRTQRHRLGTQQHNIGCQSHILVLFQLAYLSAIEVGGRNNKMCNWRQVIETQNQDLRRRTDCSQQTLAAQTEVKSVTRGQLLYMMAEAQFPWTGLLHAHWKNQRTWMKHNREYII